MRRVLLAALAAILLCVTAALATTPNGGLSYDAVPSSGGSTSTWEGDHGETLTRTWDDETLTFAGNPGNATKTSTADFIPQGAHLLGVTTRVLVAGTNCTSFSIGDGATADLWGHNISPALSTTTANASATANWAIPVLADSAVTLTANGGNCFDLSVRVTVVYDVLTPPTE